MEGVGGARQVWAGLGWTEGVGGAGSIAHMVARRSPCWKAWPEWWRRRWRRTGGSGKVEGEACWSLSVRDGNGG